ncbi:hypothetical protein CE195_09930, partial [Sodalis-like symbiont of Philaenus spumarius]
RELRRMSGVTLERDAWQLDHVPDHLADYRSLHCALLTGLLSHIGQKDTDKQEYTGTRNALSRLAITEGCLGGGVTSLLPKRKGTITLRN